MEDLTNNEVVVEEEEYTVPIEEEQPQTLSNTAVVLASDDFGADIINGEDPSNRLIENLSGANNAQDQYVNEQQKFRERMVQDFQDGVLSQEDFLKNKEMLDKVQQTTLDSMNVYVANQYPDVEPEVRAEMALSMTINHMIAESRDEEDWLGTTESFLGLLAPTRQYQAMDKIGEGLVDLGYVSEEDADGYLASQFSAGAVLTKMHQVYNNLPDNEKLTFVQAVVPLVKKSTDNPFIQDALVEAIINDNFDPDWETAWGYLDASFVADVAITGRAISKALVATAKRGGLGGAVEYSGNPELYEKLASIIQEQPEVARKLMLEEKDIADLADATLTPEVAAVLGSLSGNSAGKLLNDMHYMDARVAAYVKSKNNVAILTPEEELAVMQRAEQSVKDMFGDDTVKSINFEKGEDGFTMNYEVLPSLKGGVSEGVKDGSLKVNYKFNDEGGLTIDTKDFHWFGLSANDRLRGDLNDIVKSSEAAVLEKAKAVRVLDDLLVEATRGLSKRTRNEVYKVLEDGDKYGRVFTVGELHKRGLDGKQVNSYYKMRKYLDITHGLKEDEYIRAMKAAGIKHFDDGSEAGSQAVKVHNDAKDARKAYNEEAEAWNYSIQDEDGVRVINGREGAKELKIDEMYARGYVMVSTDDVLTGIRIGDSNTKWAFVKKDAVQDPIPGRTLSKRPGYFPRTRSNGRWFVKQKTAPKVSGYAGKGTYWSTKSYSDGLKGAEELKSELIRDLIEAGEDPETAKNMVQVFEDGGQSAGESFTRGDIGGGSGLFQGARSSEDLTFRSSFNNTGEKPEKADKVMRHMIEHTSRYVTNTVRSEQMERRVLKALNEKFGLEAPNFFQLEKAIASLEGKVDYSLAKMMIDNVNATRGLDTGMSRTISDLYWQRARALEESKIANFIGDIPFIPHPARLAYALSSGRISPSGAIRGATFTCYLAAGNMAQLVVQGSGMIVPFSTNPAQFAKAMPSMVGSLILDTFASDFRAQQMAIEYFRKTPGMKEFAENYELWANSGFREAVLEMQSDAVTFLGHGATAGKLSKGISNASTFAYRNGELLNSRAAFFTAAVRHKAKNKGFNPSKAKPEDIAAIAKRAEEYKLNMGKGNRTLIQDNPILSVPFQFMQVVHKFYSKVMPKGFGGTDEFTGWEKARLAGFSVGVMGGAGAIPGGDWMVQQFLEYSGIDARDLSEEDAVLLRYGLAAQYLRFEYGLNNDVTTRLTLGTDLVAMVGDMVVNNDALGAMLGASGGVSERAASAAMTMHKVLSPYFDPADPDPFENEDLVFIMSSAMKATGTLFTSTRNGMTYWDSVVNNEDIIRGVHGQNLYLATDVNDRSRYLAMFGFGLSDARERWEFDKKYNPKQGTFGWSVDKDAEILLSLLDSAMAIDKYNGTDSMQAKLARRMVALHPDGKALVDTALALGAKTQPKYNDKMSVNNVLVDISKNLVYGEEALWSVMLSKHTNPYKEQEQ